MNKFWTIQSGKLGTAHINREGKLVDFREGKVIPRSQHNTGKIMVVAENDCAEPLNLDFRVVDGWFDPNDWNHQFNEAGTATKIALFFEGQEVELEVGRWFEIRMPISEEQKQLARNAFNARMEKQKREKAEQNELDQKAIEKFKQNFSASLKGQEKRWIRRFKEDSRKARQELVQAIESREGGKEFLRHNKLEAILELV